MRIGEFTYRLPRERIAQRPVEPRDASRLLVLDRASGAVAGVAFRDLGRYLEPGDLLVVNDTRVVPARLRGHKETGGTAEVLLLAREGPDRWEALVRATKRARVGTRVRIDRDLAVVVTEVRGEGRYGVQLEGSADPLAAVEAAGEMPLPPYIRRDADPRDREWYQTVFARPEAAGSAAAPTAGLHFSDRVLADLDARGVDRCAITLHVGLGTFLPIRTDSLADHRMHREWFRMSPESAAAVNRVLDRGGRVVAVGTTVARVLEHSARGGRVAAGAGWTELFLRPGHRFQVVGGLLTNFHLPESTLLVLVCAFGGTGPVLSAYRHAVAEGYRFYSYGDAMLVL